MLPSFGEFVGAAYQMPVYHIIIICIFRAAYRRLMVDRTGCLHAPMPLSHIRRDVDKMQLDNSSNCNSESRLDALPTASSLSIVGQNVTAYIAGFVARQLLRSLQCDSCKQALTDSENETLLISIKSRGGLLQPSRELCRLAAAAEQQVRSAAARAVHLHCQLVAACVREAVDAGIFSTLRCTESSDESHRYFLLQRACESFVRVRVFHLIRQHNLDTQSVRHQLTKKVIFMGQ
jgi:hypothetical protein